MLFYFCNTIYGKTKYIPKITFVETIVQLIMSRKVNDFVRIL